MSDKKKHNALLYAAENADWGQVVLNGGPPCFHICEDGLFCLRAERWDGHAANAYPAIHKFVSLHAMLAARERKEG
jgi:hypothetical protein